MAEERAQRRLAAILAADVVGYSRLMGLDETGTRTRFNEQLDNIVQPAIDLHGGRLVKTMGDGFLVEFGSVVEAVQCAADNQGDRRDHRTRARTRRATARGNHATPVKPRGMGSSATRHFVDPRL